MERGRGEIDDGAECKEAATSYRSADSMNGGEGGICVWFRSWPFGRFVTKQRDSVSPVNVIERKLNPRRK